MTASPAILNTEMLTTIAAKLFEHSDNVKSVPWQDIALNLRLAARLAEKNASLRFRVQEIAEMALTQDPGATARDLRDALNDAEFRHGRPHQTGVYGARSCEQPETIFARDGTQAWGHALNLIAKRQFLIAGDVLAVRRADEPDDEQIVEILRAPGGTP